MTRILLHVFYVRNSLDLQTSDIESKVVSCYSRREVSIVDNNIPEVPLELAQFGERRIIYYTNQICKATFTVKLV